MLEEALALFTDVGAEEEIVDVVARTAECHMLMGDGEGALRLVDDARARLQGTEAATLSTALIGRITGYSLMMTGEPEQAGEALERSLAAAREQGLEHEVASTLNAMIRLARWRGGGSPQGASDERDEILAEARHPGAGRAADGPRGA